MTYDVYPFPVYGTVSSGSSTILVFNPCQRLAFPEERKIFPLIISLHADYCSMNSETICNPSDIFGYNQVNGAETSNCLTFFLNVSEGGSPVGLELFLKKSVSSAGNATFNVGFAGTPSYTPLYTNKQLAQQTIVINIQRDVTVTTYSPKSILSLLGSLSGIFSAFMAISGVVSSMIWSRFGEKQAVTVGKTSLQDLSQLE